MTPLVVDALDRQSDCSSASSGVAAARRKRVEYVDRIMTCWLALKDSLVQLDLLRAVAGELESEMR